MATTAASGEPRTTMAASLTARALRPKKKKKQRVPMPRQAKSWRDGLTKEEIRDRNRTYIRVEQNAPTYQWNAFLEQCRREDVAAMRFQRLLSGVDRRDPPPEVQRIIERSRRKVSRQVKAKGGSTASIIRQTYLDWDGNNSGGIDSEELLGAMRVLGVPITEEEASIMIAYYDSGNGEMVYGPFLDDIAKGERTITEHAEEPTFRGPDPFSVRTDRGPYPLLLQQFFKGLNRMLSRKIRDHGGTESEMIKVLFLNWDRNCTTTLSVDEFQGSMHQLGLPLTRQQAEDIVLYYTEGDRTAELPYKALLKDLQRYQGHFMVHPEITARTLQAMDRKDPDDPFNLPSTRIQPIKLVEKFKGRLQAKLLEMMRDKGGSVTSWLHQACKFWDGSRSGSLSPQELLGAMRRLNMPMVEAEANAMVQFYDLKGEGKMPYEAFIHDMDRQAHHFLSHPQTDRSLRPSSAVDTSAEVTHLVRKLRQASIRLAGESNGDAQDPSGSARNPDPATASARSGGGLTSRVTKQQRRAALEAVFMLYDASNNGLLTQKQLKRALRHMGVKASQLELDAAAAWYAHPDGRLEATISFDDIIGDAVGDAALRKRGSSALQPRAPANINATDSISELLVPPEPSPVRAVGGRRGRGGRGAGRARRRPGAGQGRLKQLDRSQLSSSGNGRSQEIEQPRRASDAGSAGGPTTSRSRRKAIVAEKARIERRLKELEEETRTLTARSGGGSAAAVSARMSARSSAR